MTQDISYEVQGQFVRKTANRGVRRLTWQSIQSGFDSITDAQHIITVMQRQACSPRNFRIVRVVKEPINVAA